MTEEQNSSLHIQPEGAQVDDRCNLRLYRMVLERHIALICLPALGSEVQV